MAVFTIPTTTNGLQRLSVTLDEVRYVFELQYNDRDSSWYLNILDANGDQIRSGIRMVIDWPLTLGFQAAIAPEGTLFVERTDSGTGEVSRLELGQAAEFFYEGDS